MADPNNIKSIFLAAAEKSPSERPAFLDQAVGGDTALRVRVEALLKAHDNPDSFLNEAAAKFGVTMDLAPADSVAEQPGTLIGPYKLLEQIGEGGMGVVYMADQQAPVRRRVALKIIKAGMDTRQVIARFEAERQALALMDHSNIARVLDVGATESGRPYFVMELVRGVPITAYCDQNNLPVHQRLELFVQVCHAVQHAHQKGIIHRDLKPSNVLVTLNDGRAVPKVIDFGVAKATGQQLTEKTLFTAFAQMVGTPLYMSPEQAEMTSVDIDTRSDIYSLGVLLYELLAGTTPFDPERMRAAAFDEIRRIIREEEPPRPSTRISTLGESRTATAAHRQVDPKRLSRLMEGDLDWIVMKCLEKDRTRRYDTATTLALDVVRYLNDEPVEACPPKRMYRLKKFVRRNRVGVLTTSVVVALLVAGVIVLTVTNARIRRASKAKDAALVTSFEAVEQMLVRVADERLTEVPLAQPLRRALLEDALSFYDGFLAQLDADASLGDEARAVLSRRTREFQMELGRYDDARRTLEREIALAKNLIASQPREMKYRVWLASGEENLGYLLQIASPLRDNSESEVHFQRALKLFAELERDWPNDPQPVTFCLRHLAEAALKRGDKAEAERLWSDSIRKGKRYLTKDPDAMGRLGELCWACVSLGDLLTTESRFDEAETVLRNGLSYVSTGLRHERHPLLDGEGPSFHVPGGLRTPFRNVDASLNHRLASVYCHTRRVDQAIPLFQHAVDEIESLCVASPSNRDNWATVRYFHADIVRQLQPAGRTDEAKKFVRQVVEWVQQIAARVPDEPVPQDELRLTEIQAIKAMHSTGQTEPADSLIRAILENSANVLQHSPKERIAIAKMRLELLSHLVTGPIVDKAIAKKIHAALDELAPHPDAFREADMYERFEAANMYIRLGKGLAADSAWSKEVNEIEKRLLALLRTFRNDFPKSDYAWEHVGHTLRFWAFALPWDGAHLARVEAAFREAVRVYEQMTVDFPDSWSAGHLLADSHRRVALILERMSKTEAAEAEYRLAVTFYAAHESSYDKHAEDNPERAFCYIEFAAILARTGRLAEAENLHRTGCAVMEKSWRLQPLDPGDCNELAWKLATSPIEQFRDPGLAVELAGNAVKLATQRGNFWNTLGVAHYRAGEWESAIKALEKSMELRKGGDAFDWFFLSMAHWQLGHKVEGCTWFDKSVAWADKNQPKNGELVRFRAEAAKLVGIAEPQPSTGSTTQP